MAVKSAAQSCEAWEGVIDASLLIGMYDVRMAAEHTTGTPEHG